MAAPKNDSGPLRPFFRVRKWLEMDAEGTDLRILDRAVLMQLAGFMQPGGVNGRPSNQRLSAILGTHPDSIRRSLRRLKAAGLVEPTVDHPHSGLAQNWRLSAWFSRRLRDLEAGPESTAYRRTGEYASVDGRRTGESGQADPPVGEGVPGSTPIDMIDRSTDCEHEFQDSGPNGQFRVCRLCGSSPKTRESA